MRLPLLLVSLLALGTSAFAAPQVLGTKTLVDHGDPSNRYDVVFVGDGYRAADRARFERQVARAVELLKSTSPFKEYWGYVNVHRIDVASSDYGVTQKGQGKRNTAFDVTYGGSLRYVNGDREAIQRTVARHAPDADAIVCLFPDLWGGVSYGEVCFASGEYPRTIVHELGHTIGRVADEYDSAEIKVPQALLVLGELLGRPILCAMGWRFRNVTSRTQRSAIPWRHWISPSTPLPTHPSLDRVGLHEGALHLKHGIYRPEQTCLMRRENAFCVVCREELTLALSAKVVPYSWTARRLSGGGMSLGFKTIVPGRVTARWFSGEAPVAATPSVRVLANGSVRLEVADATPFVRSDPQRTLVHSCTFTVEGAKVSTRTDLHRQFGQPGLRGDWRRHFLLGDAGGITAHLPN
ncbi:MAG: hypothetical protein KDD82_23165 [Planctomycetes bacterium]|nr:hypothetical protein [Planctomycetota bacterium]